MVRKSPLLLAFALSGLFGALAGCRNTAENVPDGPRPPVSSVINGSEPGPRPERASGTGMLLRTGAIQLGPDVGRNLWRWQGDGEGGF